MGKIVKLVLVSGDVNSNKFYDMSENSDGTFKSVWGRVGLVGASKDYPMSDWDRIYKDKTKKGYKDITHLCAVDGADVAATITIDNTHVKELITFLRSSASNAVKQNYTVAASSVTDKQVKEAQSVLDEIATFAKTGAFNPDVVDKMLLALYTTIPRKMKDPRQYLTKSSSRSLSDIIETEQSLLDAMRGQVQVTQQGSAQNLEDYGITVEPATDDDLEIIRKTTDFQLSNHRVFRVTNLATEAAFVKGKETLLYHGSRNQNWWNIVTQGLVIRPSNAVHTGSMFGDAIYFANKARKSIGYTSLSGSCWAGGNERKAYLALYAVSLGKSWPVLANQRWDNWMSRIDQKQISSKGYDSVFASGGADLKNDEFMIYSSNRCTIRYLIELKA